MSDDKDVVLISSAGIPIGKGLLMCMSNEVNCSIHFKTRLVREALTKNQKRKMSARRIKKEQDKVMPSYSTGKLRG